MAGDLREHSISRKQLATCVAIQLVPLKRFHLTVIVVDFDLIFLSSKIDDWYLANGEGKPTGGYCSGLELAGEIDVGKILWRT